MSTDDYSLLLSIQRCVSLVSIISDGVTVNCGIYAQTQ